MNRIFCLIAMLAVLSAVFAAPTFSDFTIQGTVTAAGSPVQNAVVGVKTTPSATADADVVVNPSEPSGNIWYFVTDTLGRFGPSVLIPAGTYYVGVWADGYKTVEQQVVLDSDKTLDIQLTEATGVNIAYNKPVFWGPSTDPYSHAGRIRDGGRYGGDAAMVVDAAWSNRTRVIDGTHLQDEWRMPDRNWFGMDIPWEPNVWTGYELRIWLGGRSPNSTWSDYDLVYTIAGNTSDTIEIASGDLISDGVTDGAYYAIVSTTGDHPVYMGVDLGQNEAVNQVVVDFFIWNVPYDYAIMYAADDGTGVMPTIGSSAWQTYYQTDTTRAFRFPFQDDSGPWEAISSGTANGRWWMIYVTSSSHSWTPGMCFGVRELEIYPAGSKLYLGVPADSLYVKPDETVTVTLNQASLTTPVSGYQAFLSFDTNMLSFSSGYYTSEPYGLPVITPITATTEGYIDTAAGIDPATQNPTTEDANLAVLIFTAGSTEGTTQVTFREHDPATMFTNQDGDEIIPVTTNSQTIVIDGTPPTDVTITADPSGWTNANNVTLTFSATDALAGIDHYELSLNGGDFFTATSPYDWDVSGLGSGTYPATVKAVDKAGNYATATTYIYIDRTGPSLDIISAKQGTPGTPFNATGFTYTKILDGGTHILSAAGFSPDGSKVVFLDRTSDGVSWTVKLYDRRSGAVTTLMSDNRTGTGSGFWGFSPPYFSADGSKIGWAKGFYDAAGIAVVYDIATSTITLYNPPPGSTQDFYNTDFLGAYTDQWVGWDYGAGGNVADIFHYTQTGGVWQETSNLTNTSNYKEYEPDSNTAGTKILYWSGETSTEPLDTTHVLVWNGTGWVKDVGFTPIPGSTWAYWSRDENEIGVTKYDAIPGYGKGDLYVYDSAGNFKFDLTGDAVGQGSYWQFFGFNFATGPAGEGREYLFTSGAANTQGGRDVWIAKMASDPELIYSYRSGTPFAVQGKVYIKVTASDDNGLAGTPIVTVKDAANYDMPVTYIGESPAGTFIYSVDVLATTTNGMATVSVQVADTIGNISTDTDYFDINKTTAAVTVKLQGVTTPTTRWIKFVIGGTGGSVPPVTIEKQVSFDSTGTAYVTFEGLSYAGQWTRISAKDEQHTLRQTVDLTDTGNQQYSASFTGSDALMGGDVNNDQMVDIRDFGIYAGQYGTSPALDTKWPIRNANISCDGYVDTNDFTYIQINFLKVSDPGVGYAIADAQIPISSITVNDLAKQIGVVAAKKADLNYDGVVDQKDMALFAKKMK